MFFCMLALIARRPIKPNSTKSEADPSNLRILVAKVDVFIQVAWKGCALRTISITYSYTKRLAFNPENIAQQDSHLGWLS